MSSQGHGLPVGSAVEVNGKLGQLVEYCYDGTCKVCLLNGEHINARVASLKPPQDPGCDVLVGPKLQLDVLAQEVSQCLFAKGYCLLKVCQDPGASDSAQAFMKGLDEEGSLERLPLEVEEGYLGFGGRGKVVWLDTLSDSTGPVPPLLRENDNFISTLIYSILPYGSDVLGALPEQRTPALLSLWLKENETADYPSPFPDDKTLSNFLNRFERTLLKATYFMGPSNMILKLDAKEASEEEPKDGLPSPPKEQRIEVTPNSILLYNPAYLNMYIDVNRRKFEQSLMINVTILKSDYRPEVVGRWNSMDALNTYEKIGAAPNLERPSIENLSTRLAAGWDDPDYYRAGLTGGCDTGVEFQRSRFDYEAYYWPDVETAMPWHICCKHTGYVEALDMFDNKYFNIPANEAITMDSMQRHLLETGCMNLYQMGITKKVADRTPHHAGCAVGLDKDDWTVLDATQLDDKNRGSSPNVQAIISNRFAYVFNMKGANFVADTACSASLSVAHLAYQMMKDRTGDALEFFVVMGLHQCLLCSYHGAHQGHMITMNGRCTTFNETADGYMRADACSGLVFKWAKEQDNRMAVWRGSAIGQNGRSATLTAPNGLAQEDLIWKAIRDAGTTPPESAHWSCHGTGTSLGDPIEIGGMRKVQNKQSREGQALIVNTNKPNTGHAEGGAAMTSLVAVVLQLRQMKANPLCHIGVLNPHLEGSHFDGWYCTELSSTNLRQSHAHVSSFGFGGSNAHCLMHGEDQFRSTDPKTLFLKKLIRMPQPAVRPLGKDPAAWETDGLERGGNPGDIFSITITTEDESDATAKYVLEQEGLGVEFDKRDSSYSIMGSFNGYEPLMMEDGDVPGLHTITVEMPRSGEIEFNLVNTVEPELVLAPDDELCKKRSTKICGPTEGLTNKWLITGEAKQDVRIDLFIAEGAIALNWVFLDPIVTKPLDANLFKSNARLMESEE